MKSKELAITAEVSSFDSLVSKFIIKCLDSWYWSELHKVELNNEQVIKEIEELGKLCKKLIEKDALFEKDYAEKMALENVDETRIELYKKQIDEQCIKLIKYHTLIEKDHAEKKVLENADEILEKRNKELEAECMINRKKLQKCIPSGLLICLIVSFGILSSCLTIFIMQILANIKLVDFYIIFFILIGGTGLFHTSLSAIKGWKRYLNDEKG